VKKILKYGMVTLQHRGVVFMTVLLRNMCTYLVGLRPANLISLHSLLLPLVYLYVLVAVIRKTVVTLTSLIAETHCPLSYNITGIYMCGFAAADLLRGLECDVRVSYVISCLTLTVTGGAPHCCASHGTFHLYVSRFQGSIKRN
jgi:hypothetical protein